MTGREKRGDIGVALRIGGTPFVEPFCVQGGDKTIQWSAADCGVAGGVKVGHRLG